MFDVYLWLDSEGAELTRFVSSLPDKYRGQIGDRQKLVDGVVKVAGQHWQSPSFARNEQGPTSCAIECLKTYRPFLQQMKADLLSSPRWAARVSSALSQRLTIHTPLRLMLSVVGEFKTLDEAQGLHISHELVELLQATGAELDYDVTRDVSGAELPPTLGARARR